MRMKSGCGLCDTCGRLRPRIFGLGTPVLPQPQLSGTGVARLLSDALEMCCRTKQRAAGLSQQPALSQHEPHPSQNLGPRQTDTKTIDDRAKPMEQGANQVNHTWGLDLES